MKTLTDNEVELFNEGLVQLKLNTEKINSNDDSANPFKTSILTLKDKSQHLIFYPIIEGYGETKESIENKLSYFYHEFYLYDNVKQVRLNKCRAKDYFNGKDQENIDVITLASIWLTMNKFHDNIADLKLMSVMLAWLNNEL